MLNILHLSDLHFGSASDAENWYSQLADDLTGELGCDRLDAVIISGDIANYATPQEYQAAQDFLTSLANRFEVQTQRIVLVPGNHDLNWEASKKAYRLKDLEECKGELKEGCYFHETKTIVRARLDDQYKERFFHFSEFYRSVKGEPYPLEYGRQAILHVFDDLGLLILGLNSAWEGDHHFKSRASVHPDAVSLALNKIRDQKAFQDYRKFAVWHHPLNSPSEDRIIDHGFMERLAQCGFCACFHGHIHKAKKGLYRYDMSPRGRKLHIVGAGTFGAPIREWSPGHPLQYNLLAIEGDTLTVNTRCRREPNGAWTPDAIWLQGEGRDPLPRYAIDLPSDPSGDNACGISDGSAAGIPLEKPRYYLKWIAERCRYMDIDRLRDKGRVIQVRLPEMYVPLLAHPPVSETKKNEEKQLAPMDREQAARIVDLLADHDALLVEGLPGSGKTTLAKHLALSLSGAKENPLGADWLPVLVFLREMQGLGDTDRPKNGAESAELFLEGYFRKTGCGLDLETLKFFCLAGKAVFLLDGLDEIERSLRDEIASAFADILLRYEGCKILLSGRPHGMDGSVVDRFGASHIRILPLSMDQVEDFITRWFRFVYDEAASLGQKTSRDLIGDVRSHPNITQLIDNPLMLTAVCMLYHDGSELPGQRAALYKKFVSTLLYRRFEDPEKVMNFLMGIALEMQSQALEGVDRAASVDILGKVYLQEKNESDTDYRNRLNRLFEGIEPDCGLLTLKSGQYAFRHLTFQEFLAAAAIIARETDYEEAIKTHWTDERYQEVCELFVGVLSIENKRWANKIVEGALAREEKAPFYGWRLAARALLDIHPDHREASVESATRKQMIEVMASNAEPKIRVQAGETLGWIGDPKDLEAFVPVSGGPYQLSMGKRKVASFEIAKYPVTNGWFARFVNTKGYEDRQWWGDEGWKWLDHSGARHPSYWYARRFVCPNAPVVGVCWYEADAFARWMTAGDTHGYRYFLPEEIQWEAAAAGTGQREYPWEGEWEKGRCNSEEAGNRQAEPRRGIPGRRYAGRNLRYGRQRLGVDPEQLSFDESLQRFPF